MSVRITAVELIRVDMPFREPFRSSLGMESGREALLVRVLTDGAEGWGECAAPARPLYSDEHVAAAHSVIRDRLAPALIAAREVEGSRVSEVLAAVQGYPMAKAALQMAVLDAELRGSATSLTRYLGGTRATVACGVVIGIVNGIPQLLEVVARRLEEGYRRIKLKVEPGWDVQPVAAVRERFGSAVPLSVDANGAYTLHDLDALAQLDGQGLLMLEEPLGGRSLPAHAELARRLRTPVCLDESIPNAQAAAEAGATGAAAIINIKPGRVGGVIEALRMHDLCAQMGVPVWCGGMFETGLGRAANLALAALPNFTLPGDISPAGRHYAVELTVPAALMHDGHMAVPTEPGLGVQVDRGAVDSVAVSREVIRS
jgi:o-succinylbenzoate synthase